MNNQDKVKYIIHKFNCVSTRRSNYEPQWRDINKYILPERGKNFGGKTSEGSPINQQTFDSTAIKACEDLASGLQSMLTSPSARWFQLSPGDRYITENSLAARDWIQTVENIMYFVFQSPQMKFYNNTHQCYLDIAAFGTAVMLIEADTQRRLIKFKSIQLDECYIDEDSFGEIDTLFRKFEYSPGQIIEEFRDNLSQESIFELEDMIEKSPTRKIEILHAVFPRRTRNEMSLLPQNMPYASFYIRLDKNEILSESGYREFPYVVPRWYTRSGEVYGTSPGMTCLSDVKMLNQMSKTTIVGARKRVQPAYQMPDDGFLEPLDVRPDAINYYRSGSTDRIEPINMAGDVGLGLDMEEQRRMSIRNTFYADLMFDNKTARMTTQEVLQREEARMRIMAPQLGRMHVEFMSPIIRRTFAILARFNLIPPMPEELNSTYLKPDYISPVARAQKVLQATNVQRMFEQMAGFAQIAPEIFDGISPDGLAKWLIDLYDAPANIQRSDEEKQQLRDQRQQMADTQMQMNLMQQGADIAQKTGLGAAGA